MTAGIAWNGSGSIDVRNATMTGNGDAIHLNASLPLAVKVRGSTLSNNTNVGVALVDSPDVVTLDLGTTADPGMNTLTGNTTSGIRLQMPATATVNAVGNTWNAAQSADGSGHYTAGTTVTGPVGTGANYVIGNASTLNL